MLTNWNEIISALPHPHILQSREWAAVKSRYGWKATPVIWLEKDGEFETCLGSEVNVGESEPVAAALLLRRKMLFGANVMYAPKGPLLSDWGHEVLRVRVLQDLKKIAHQAKAIFIKIDPDVVVGRGVPGQEGSEEDPLGADIHTEWQAMGWRFSPDQIQYRNTVLVDLTATEDDILGRMKSKTRYNIRLASRKGVTVRVGDQEDLGMLYKMYAETSLRGGFAIRGEEYYRSVWEIFAPSGVEVCPGSAPIAEPLIAEVEGEAVAGAVVFRFGQRAWYLHGMSAVTQREKMPAHLVQWEAMRWAKEVGCTVYDMWGAPNIFEENDPMWGVYRFKRGFGGEVSRTIGAWDLPLRPRLYNLYTLILPKILDAMRRFREKQTKEIAS